MHKIWISVVVSSLHLALMTGHKGYISAWMWPYLGTCRNHTKFSVSLFRYEHVRQRGLGGVTVINSQNTFLQTSGSTGNAAGCTSNLAELLKQHSFSQNEYSLFDVLWFLPSLNVSLYVVR